MFITTQKLFPALALISISVLMQSCDSGSSTVPNPNLGGTSNQTYNGPPPVTGDVADYKEFVWEELKAQNRCGSCHGRGGSGPALFDPNDINVAYALAIPNISLIDPPSSNIVKRMTENGGHNCWLPSDPGYCANYIEQLIQNWVGNPSESGSQAIVLTDPDIIIDPGVSKTFPTLPTDNGSNSFSNTIHPLLTAHCQSCHDDSVSLPISPFFANDDPVTAYEAAKPKIDIDTPPISRFVVRLREEFHNCWTDNCADDATTMQTAIENFANITPTAVDPALITSKALKLTDGIVASGGNRHENNLIAKWEFKAGTGNTVFDTSGISPAIDLGLSDTGVAFMDEHGLDLTGGKAQADTGPSKKLHDFIRSSGEYSIEAWVIPANVTQEDANIISYSAGALSRNFTLGQALYNYDLYNRSSESDANGEEVLSTEDAGEILQSSLQHVVATYDPVAGRSIFVNGQAIAVTDPVTVSTSITDWNESYALVFGNEVSNNRSWNGKLRMVAIHNRALTSDQALQNFEVGVGQKFLLLFSISDKISIPRSYIMFEVSQFDSYSYLFNKPTFINLDPDWVPVTIEIEGLRIGINGKLANAGQVYANLNVSVDSGQYTPENGQLLSPLGTVIALEKGSTSDEFFLSFENLDGDTNPYVEADVTAPAPGADGDAVSDIGIRTFDEINASIATITGVNVTNSEVDDVFQQYRQQLPTVEDIGSFLPSHQMAIAQLALTSCSELVENNPGYFAGFNFSDGAATAFDTPAKRNQILDPLLAASANVIGAGSAFNLTSQPDDTELRDSLGSPGTQTLDGASYESLITQMTTCPGGCDTASRTAQIVKAVCAASVGSAVMLIQ